MAEFLSNFGGFVAAVAVHWLTLLAGCGATVVLALIQKFGLKMEKLPLKIEATILLCFVFFACFQAWQDEHRHAASAQSQFESLTRPNLQAQITSLYFAPASEGAVVIAEAMVVNKGAPSIATNFTADILMNDGSVIHGIILMPPAAGTKLTLGFDGSPTKGNYEASDFLPRKAIDRPIPTNGAVGGFMEILFRNVTPDEVNGKSSFRLTVKDVNGTPAEIEWPIERSTQTLIDPNVQGHPRSTVSP